MNVQNGFNYHYYCFPHFPDEETGAGKIGNLLEFAELIQV